VAIATDIRIFFPFSLSAIFYPGNPPGLHLPMVPPQIPHNAGVAIRR
jgi:hypothetical protein